MSMFNKKNVKIIIYIIFLFYIILLVYDYNKKNQQTLEHIVFKGLNFLNEKELIGLINISNSKSIFSYNLSKIKESLENSPFVESAKISIKIPGELHVQILERIPLALIIHNNNQIFVDYYNQIIPVNSKTLNNFPVPIVNINNNDSIWDPNNKNIQLIKYIFKHYNSLYNNLSELLITNSLITLITDQRTEILIDPRKAINNINKLKNFENSINSIKKIDDHKYINLIYQNQIVVKERIYI